ncbi:TIGR00282 family metallophosphoesterase [bacterium]|nr:MAG: TIGR00282 family metallophosphoesterase [bacterium]QQR61835.1 MAG: TIGR00282 family metallophosphoesterase [bacterium]QQR62583.1 MAG: TIGR00282 family metallophosphoesterase [bacterium]
MDSINIGCFGDIVGITGRTMFQKHSALLQKKYQLDGIIVNGENCSSTGRGITTKNVQFLQKNGASIITSGNHIFQNKDIYAYLDQKKDLLRPANFPSAAPGTGAAFFNTAHGVTVGVINVQGRVFMRELLSCPFKAVESLIPFVKQKTDIIFIDIHAETTAEKMGLAHYVTGKVSAVFGTHTHVQTADHRILPGGTAFITDLGMIGSLNGMLGMKKDSVVNQFVTQMPSKFEVDTTVPAVLSGVVVTVDIKTGKAIGIESVRVIENDLVVDAEGKNE